MLLVIMQDWVCIRPDNFEKYCNLIISCIVVIYQDYSQKFWNLEVIQYLARVVWNFKLCVNYECGNLN